MIFKILFNFFFFLALKENFLITKRKKYIYNYMWYICSEKSYQEQKQITLRNNEIINRFRAILRYSPPTTIPQVNISKLQNFCLSSGVLATGQSGIYSVSLICEGFFFNGKLLGRDYAWRETAHVLKENLKTIATVNPKILKSFSSLQFLFSFFLNSLLNFIRSIFCNFNFPFRKLY